MKITFKLVAKTHDIPVDLFDRQFIDVDCPRCALGTPATLAEFRRREVIVCRGCHSNIALSDDHEGYSRARARMKEALQNLFSGLGG